LTPLPDTTTSHVNTVGDGMPRNSISARVHKSGRRTWTWYYDDHHGHRNARAFDTLEDAEAERAAWIRKGGGGLATALPLSVTLADFWAYWLAHLSTKRKPRTRASYASQMRHFLAIPELSNARVRNISRAQIRSALHHAIEAGKHSASTLSLRLKVISIVMQAAVEEGLREYNPARGLRAHLGLGKQEREQSASRRKPLTADELKRFIEVSRSRGDGYQFHLVMAYAGLRISEVIVLREEDFRFDRQQISVERQLNTDPAAEDPSMGTIVPPKSGMPRLVDMHPDIEREMRALFAERAAMRANGYALPSWVFVNLGPDVHARLVPRLPADRFLDLFREDFREMRRLVGLDKYVVPHSLRHTFGTRLAEAGMQDSYIQQQMGHSSITVTIDTYARYRKQRNVDGLTLALGTVDVPEPATA
jgi:integrase